MLSALQKRRVEIRQEFLDSFDGSNWASWLIANRHATGQRQADRIVDAMGLKDVVNSVNVGAKTSNGNTV